jgi:hypothetical protein
MMSRCLSLLLGFLLLGSAGCMQTRYVETSSTTTCGVGCYPSACRDSTYSERRWCGFWPGQPARVQP